MTSKNPTIHELFAHTIKLQMQEEMEPHFDQIMEMIQASGGAQDPRFDMADWFRSLGIPTADANTYIQNLFENHITSLQELSSVTEETLTPLISKIGHRSQIISNINSLKAPLTLAKARWEWHDGISWIQYLPEVTFQLNSAISRNQSDTIIMSGHNQIYRIDLVRLYQVNLRTGFKRRIRRDPPLSVSIETPEGFLCPIGKGLMKDPVIASDGFSYERANIEQFIASHTGAVPILSPKTGKVLNDKSVTSNHTLRNTIEEWEQLQKSVTLEAVVTCDSDEKSE
eukprot:c9489_g1_i1.p1 GENE.c9489_g1_i1~~c9489_g1_i1.p1  ORF type:complete len:284 (-),score=70.56 c9489_g1_i1:57-908(-)